MVGYYFYILICTNKYTRSFFLKVTLVDANIPNIFLIYGSIYMDQPESAELSLKDT